VLFYFILSLVFPLSLCVCMYVHTHTSLPSQAVRLVMNRLIIAQHGCVIGLASGTPDSFTSEVTIVQ